MLVTETKAMGLARVGRNKRSALRRVGPEGIEIGRGGTLTPAPRRSFQILFRIQL